MKNLKAGLYWGRLKDWTKWHLIIEIHGESPFLELYQAWNVGNGNFHERDDLRAMLDDIVFGDRLETPEY